MISKLNYKQLIPSVMVATSLILSACQETGQQVSPRVASTANSLKTQNLTSLTDEEKKFEIDPLQHPAYKSYLSSQFEKISQEGDLNWVSLFRLKFWLVAPLDSAKNSATVSASYTDLSNVANSVVARQSQNKIWIDADLFEKMNTQDKAQVMLGEYLTSLYSMKNLSDNDICLMINRLKANTCNVTTEDTEKEAIPAGRAGLTVAAKTEGSDLAIRKAELPVNKKSTKNPLSQDDVLNIKTVKAYIITQGASLKSQDLMALMKTKGFDSRVFDALKLIPYSQETEATTEVASTDGEKYADSLFAQLQTLAKGTCFAVTLGTKSECTVAVQAFEGEQAAGVKIEVKDAANVVLSEAFYKAKNAKPQRIVDAETKTEKMIWRVTSVPVSEKKAGALYRDTFLLASVEHSADGVESVKFEAILSAPGSIVSVTIDKATSKSTCVGELVEAKDMASDILLIGGSDKYLEFAKKNVAAMQKPLAPCW